MIVSDGPYEWNLVEGLEDSGYYSVPGDEEAFAMVEDVAAEAAQAAVADQFSIMGFGDSENWILIVLGLILALLLYLAFIKRKK